MKSTIKPLRLFLFLPLVILITSTIALGQARSTLRGLITDELGAAIVGASVTLTDSTGVQKKTTTNAEGMRLGQTSGDLKPVERSEISEFLTAATRKLFHERRLKNSPERRSRFKRLVTPSTTTCTLHVVMFASS